MNDLTAVDQLNELASDYWALTRYASPLTAILAGEIPEDPVLFRESPGDHDRQSQRCGELLERLLAVAVEALPAQERATWRLLRRELETIRRAHALGAHLRPFLFPAGPEFNLVFLANSTSLTTLADAERYLEQLATVPDLFVDLKASLEAGIARGFRYPAHVVKRSAEAARANLRDNSRESPLFGPFQRGNAAHIASVQAVGERAAALIDSEIMPALADYVRFISEVLGANSRNSIGLNRDAEGEAFYDHLVRHYTSLDIDADGVHELGLSEVMRLTAALQAVAAEAGFAGRLNDYRVHLGSATEFFASDQADHLTRVRATCKRIDSMLPAYFAELPRITYGVECIPAALAETLPPAYAQPGPADKSSPGIFWVSPQRDKCPIYMYPSLALHEAWPGHLMQIALMQEQTTLPAFRRNGAQKYTACVEGWAMYCEELGVEMGLYDTPHEHFGRLNMEIWRAVRLVVDTAIHTRGWTREQAIAYMTEHVSLTPAMIEAEVDRYMALPGQALAYQPGNLKFRELRRRAEQRLGDRFDIRRFHNALIAAGPVTLPILEELCDSWIDNAGAEEQVA